MDHQQGSFYLGALFDPDSEGGRGEALLYDGDDLATHGIIVGMTGSGKTGLGVCLLEEALRSDVPCLIIDPKGDMANLRLVFPEFLPSDFAPWIDPGRAEGDTALEEAAADAAASWRAGLESWGLGTEQMHELSRSEVTIYTPGSSAGVPLNVLGSLSAPDLSWDEHSETLRDEIEGFVSSLLVLSGVGADPVSSPSHILLSTLIESEWRAGRDLDLARLVGMVPDPPLRKLGVFELDKFYPKKDRTALAMKLNGLLASPSFASWLEGEPLSIEHLLTGDRTQAAVIYLAHLDDSARQFVVTLLLAKLVTWMRSQPGTGRLRALVYMDEMFGFAPPVAEPPSKKQILTILKQARAFGVGMVLATQNPMDLDYMTMANAGTWMVGRLQTENDKRRILEGMSDAGGSTDVSSVDTLISNLANRQFVLRRAGRSETVIFSTRWAMSYLAGPLDRAKVSALTSVDPRPATTASPADPTSPTSSEVRAMDEDLLSAPPPVAEGIGVTHLDPAASWASQVDADPTGTMWKAVAAATVDLSYASARAGVDHHEVYEAVIDPLSMPLKAASVIPVDHDPRDFRVGPPPAGDFRITEIDLDGASQWRSLESQLRDHLVETSTVTVWKNTPLKLFARVGETEDEFRTRCRTVAAEAADADMAKLQERYQTRIDRVRGQISAADRRVATLEADVTIRRQDETLSGVGDLLGSLVGGRSKSAAIKRASTRRSMTQRAATNLESAKDKRSDGTEELAKLEGELAAEVDSIVDAWNEKADTIEALEISLKKPDVQVSELKVVWVPI
ncbi:ATP-binding protein [soil metagenome]